MTDAFLQLSAYKGAYESLYDVQIQQGLIIVISPNNLQLFSLDRQELDKYWDEWSIRLQQYQSFNLTFTK